MKILGSLLFALATSLAVGQGQADLTQATFSGYDRNLSFSVNLGYRGSRLISGTNVRFKPSAAVSEEKGIYHGPYPWTSYRISDFRVYVQEPVFAGAPNTQGCERIVRFSSTRFQDNQELTLRLLVTFELESEPQGYMTYKDIEVSVPVKVYNKGAVFSLFEFESSENESFHSVAVVKSALEAMNHTVVDRGDVGWGPMDFLTSMRDSTAFYINSHGNPNGFRVQDGRGSFQWVKPSDISDARDHAAQNGLPPVNFAFVDACKSGIGDDGGENHQFSFAFLRPIPEGLPNGYVGLNRAQMGWLVFADAAWAKPFNQAFWGYLRDGLTVSKARNVAIKEVFGPNAEGRHYLAVYGDYYTRLTTVYTGDDANPMGWFKVDGLEEGGLS